MPKEVPLARKQEEQNVPEEEEETQPKVVTTGKIGRTTIEIVEEDETQTNEQYNQEEEEAQTSRPYVDSIFNNRATTGAASSGSKAVALFSNQQYAITHKRNLMSMPKPKWHAPWKLYRVISGHLGWVRCIDVDPSNEWFVTGAGDRIIKIWDLASGQLKLSLTGHVSAVRGVCVSNRHPYLFSCGEDKQVKCWDLECNKVIRHYHGHLSACYALSLHPTLDILVSAGRDSVARMWDMRTKAQIHCLEGHTNTVATVKCQEVEPQVILILSFKSQIISNILLNKQVNPPININISISLRWFY